MEYHFNQSNMKEIRLYELRVGDTFAIIYGKNILTFMAKQIQSVGEHIVVTTTSEHAIKFNVGDYIHVI